jgi:uncharacterized lipoprotein YehR (DUF1307 family)
MKKKVLFLLLIIVSILFVGCEQETPKLTTPTISVNQTIVSWTEVENAKGYVVVINGVEYEEIKTSYDFSDLAIEDLVIKVKAVSASDKFLDSDFSEELNYDFKEVLTAPTISINNNIVSWTEVENAEGYLVKLNDTEVSIT